MSQKSWVDQQTTLSTHQQLDEGAAPLLVPGLVILAHPDARRVGETVALAQLASGGMVKLSRNAPRFAPPWSEELRPLADPYLSRRPVHLCSGPGTGAVTLELAGSRMVVSVGGDQITDHHTISRQELEQGAVLQLHRIVLLLTLVDPVPTRVPDFGLIGSSFEMLRLKREIRAAGELEVPILLRGETGTGKELVARALHDLGRRRRGPFVAVNMGALPPQLAASALFGAVRGAYTGADRARQGFFQSARGGTLFLDEIGEASTEVQVMLLRTLENLEVQPVGSTTSERVDVHILAATDTDLEAAVATGRFRGPLFHRLSGFEIQLPPLRKRRDDIARLLFHFLEQEFQEVASAGLPESWPPAEIVARLAASDWPGNVRQLRNVARRLAIAHRSALSPKALRRLVDHLIAKPSPLPERPTPSPPPTTTSPRGYVRRFRPAADVDEEELLAVLARHRWQPRSAAAELGVSRPTLYRLMQDCPRIRRAVDLESEEIRRVLEETEGDLERAAIRLEVSLQGLKRRMTRLDLH